MGGGRKIGSRDPSIFIDYNGNKVTLNELSEITGINYHTLYIRYRNGIRNEELWSKK